MAQAQLNKRKYSADSDSDDEFIRKIKFKGIPTASTPLKEVSQENLDTWAEKTLDVDELNDWTDGQLYEKDDEEIDALLDTEGDGVRMGIEVESCSVKTIVMDEHTGQKDEQRTYKFYRNEVGATHSKIPIGYVFQATRYDEVAMLLNRVRQGKHKSVIWYALASHMGSPCAGLFEKPTDHYHLLVWFDDASKPQDLAFHKSFYRFKHAVEWKSEKIRSERGLLQYIQCEPRELVELYCSNSHKKFVQYCYDSRKEMQEKIDARDSKKAEGRMSIKTYDDQDWWREKKMEVQAIVNVMITNAIRDVNGFLLWFAKFHPDRTIGSFVYNRDKQRLEKEINM